MNNDLTKLSNKELSDKQIEISKVSTFLMRKTALVKQSYDKLKQKRRTHPINLLKHQEEIEGLTKSQDLLNEYNRTLIDESNRRC